MDQVKQAFDKKAKGLSPMLTELEEIISELEGALEQPDLLGVRFTRIFHIALWDLSSVLGILRGGKSVDSEKLDSLLRNAHDCFEMIGENVAMSPELRRFSSKARSVISKIKREVYESPVAPDHADSPDLQLAHS